MNEGLVFQLGVARSFATDFIIDKIDFDTLLWEPSSNVVTVREIDGRWLAD